MPLLRTLRSWALMFVVGCLAGCATDAPPAAMDGAVTDGSVVDGFGADVSGLADAAVAPDASGTDATGDATLDDAGNRLDAEAPMDAHDDSAGLPDVAAPLDGGVESDVPPAIDSADDTGGPVICPPPPDDLPELQVRVQGRYHFVDAFPGEGLPPRTVRIFLPEDYEAAPERQHPVVYMHDGQNLFDPAAAAFGVEWEVDEVVDALVLLNAIPPVIVVGVDNTDDRLEEYRSGADPTTDDDTPASAYRRFLAERVKPWVDAHYRTRCGRSDTVLMGSSMGGVASIAHAVDYPDVWGRIGALSTAFWYGSNELPSWLDAHTPPVLPERLWLDVGSAESTTGAANNEFALQTRAVRDRLRALGYVVGRDLGYLEDIGAIHNEAEWARRLPEILKFLLGPGATGAPTPNAITLTPFVDFLLEGDAGTELAVQAELRGIPMTLPNDDVAFESLSPGVATVRADGHVTPMGAGTATLRATLGALEATADIQVAEEVLVTFRVTVPASTPPGDTVWVSGNRPELGTWNGRGAALVPLGDHRWELTLPVQPGTIAYKYTRGSWETVEKGPNGEELGDRTITAAPGIVTDDTVVRWADQ